MKPTKEIESLLTIIWVIALVALVGSLFYSEIIGYEPCKLCWIQRIFMYPLVVIYGYALVKRNLEIALPGLLLSGVGMLISTYHYLLQKLPALQESGDFCEGVPCNLQYVNYFGFITIPFLAGMAFIMIFIIHLYIVRRKKA